MWSMELAWHRVLQWTLDYPALAYPDTRLSGFEILQGSKVTSEFSCACAIIILSFFCKDQEERDQMAAAAEKTKTKATAKRKRVVLSINDKLEVLSLLDKSVSRSVICEKFGIGKSTVSDIWKNRDKVRAFKKDMVEMGMTRKAKVMRVSNNQKLDSALYVWFKQEDRRGSY